MKLLIATANAHKLREISILLGEEFELISLREIPDIEMPEETGLTMAQNARLKAVHCARESGLISLADDSGIEVDALGGAPGVLSARWVAGSDEDRTHALLEMLENTPDGARGARYRCAICVAFPNGKIIETEATCEGRVAREESGENGFGYDPIFELTEATFETTGAALEYSRQTMAQVPDAVKAQISHRARALRKMKKILVANTLDGNILNANNSGANYSSAKNLSAPANQHTQHPDRKTTSAMPPQLEQLLNNNRHWVEAMKERDPKFFARLAAQQKPEYLWIGCSDSRVPANEIVGLLPGEIFVHRNVANVVVHTDLNCLSVIQYAVEVLQIKHIIVCGHYGCGGVHAAMTGVELGLIDNWLRHIKDIREKHAELLDAIDDPQEREEKLCELNVIEQVFNVCHTTIVQNAWKQGHALTVRGWVYSLADGLIRDLRVQVSSRDEISNVYRTAL